MFINEVPLSDFSAKLLKRRITPLQVEAYSFWPKKALLPFIAQVKGYYYKRLELELELGGNANQIETNKSRLIKALTSASVAFRELDHVFTGVIESTGVGNQIHGFEVLHVSMLVYPHEDQREVLINGKLEDTIYLDSNHETPVIIELTPAGNLASVSLAGFGEDITLANLTGGKTVILDGEKGLITEDGLNKWQDFESWGFPRLIPGENIITLSSDTLDITVKFKPRWA